MITPTHAHVYKLRSRNLKYGAFVEPSTFIGIRKKFDYTFLDREMYNYTAFPVEETGIIVPDSIPLVISLGTLCEKCDKEVVFDQTKESLWRWYHVDKTDCSDYDVHPYNENNDELFKFLKEVEEKYETKEYRDSDNTEK